MMVDELRVRVLKDSGDARGSSFPAPEECFGGGFPVRDAHLSTLLPGHVRGNHFHVARNEILMVLSADRWSLHWDSGTGTSVEAREFDGPCAVVVRVPPHASHAKAIRRSGAEVPFLLNATDRRFLDVLRTTADPGHPASRRGGRANPAPAASVGPPPVDETSAELAAQLLQLLRLLDIGAHGVRRGRDLDEFLRGNGHQDLAVGLASTLIGYTIDPAAPLSIAGLFAAAFPVAKELFRSLGYVPASFTGPQWPFLYTYGSAAKKSQIARMLNVLNEG